jgi:hypothetical protein
MHHSAVMPLPVLLHCLLCLQLPSAHQPLQVGAAALLMPPLTPQVLTVLSGVLHGCC